MSAIASDRLELVPLSLAAMEALLDGRPDEAADEAGITIPAGWPDEHDAGFLQLRAGQLRKEPARAEWPVFAVTLRQPGRPMIGHAGFHGPPGVNGARAADAVEFGYTVFPEFRGRGYAKETARVLIDWTLERGVSHFVLCVAPDNEPSLAIVRRLGFEQTGSEWDEEDGLELVFELRL